MFRHKNSESNKGEIPSETLYVPKSKQLLCCCLKETNKKREGERFRTGRDMRQEGEKERLYRVDRGEEKTLYLRRQKKREKNVGGVFPDNVLTKYFI